MLYIEDRLYDFDLQHALTDISEQRREQALRYKYELGQRTCVLAYLLLKRALLSEYGLDGNPLFCYGPHGKPYIVGHPDIHFNLSHCRQAVACVVDTRPVGVDVESRGRYKESLARYTMNDDEQHRISTASDPALEFTKLWTMKEALLKLVGTGLRDNIRDVLDDAQRYHFSTTLDTAGHYVCTVCSAL